jgi:hypothetical protein
MAKKREGVISETTFIYTAPDGYAIKCLEKGEKVSIFSELGEYYKIGVRKYVPKRMVIEIIQPEARSGMVIEETVIDGLILVAKVPVGVYEETETQYKIRYQRKTLYVDKKYIKLT